MFWSLFNWYSKVDLLHQLKMQTSIDRLPHSFVVSGTTKTSLSPTNCPASRIPAQRSCPRFFVYACGQHNHNCRLRALKEVRPRPGGWSKVQSGLKRVNENQFGAGVPAQGAKREEFKEKHGTRRVGEAQHMMSSIRKSI